MSLGDCRDRKRQTTHLIPTTDVIFLSSVIGVRSYTKINRDALSAYLPSGYPRAYDWFGSSVTGLGDFDGDGVPDLAVGSSVGAL